MSNVIRVLAVDDEALALDVLENYIARLPQLHLVAKASMATQALEVLMRESVDLLLLDIEMPGLSGTDFLRSLNRPPAVIFTTAFDSYAVEGFELNAVDYLLKPIPFARFVQAINKFSFRADVNPAATLHSDFAEQYINLNQDKLMVRVQLSRIIYIESQKNYLKVVCTDKTVFTQSSLTAMEERLGCEHFLRVHRSFLVGLAYVESFDATRVWAAGVELPIGRNYREIVAQALR